LDSLTYGFGLKAGSEFSNLDYSSLMGSLAYLLPIVKSFNFEEETAALNGSQLAAKSDLHAHRRGGKVANVYSSANGIEALVKEGLHGVARGHFQMPDEVGGAEHSRALYSEKADCVIVVNQNGGFTLGSDGDVGHRNIILSPGSDKTSNTAPSEPVKK
jgi:hypothetical protein